MQKTIGYLKERIDIRNRNIIVADNTMLKQVIPLYQGYLNEEKNC
jgi:hypothetical protein